MKLNVSKTELHILSPPSNLLFYLYFLPQFMVPPPAHTPDHAHSPRESCSFYVTLSIHFKASALSSIAI